MIHTLLRYRPEVDGLRAIAVLLVFAFHLWPKILPGGYIGVDVFFVISGYLITHLIVREQNQGNFSFAVFYSRRVRRIFPALFAMLAGCVLLALIVLDGQSYLNFLNAFKYASAQTANLYFAQGVDYFNAESQFSPLLHTWSLGVEEQFYLVWPLLLSFFARRSRRSLLITLTIFFVLSLALSEWLTHADAKQAYYMLYSRAWQLALGGLVALTPFIWLESQISGWLGLLCILASACLLSTASRFPGLSALPATVGSAMVIVASSRSGALQDFLSKPLSLFIGKRSYSLYLWHWPLIVFSQIILQKPPGVLASTIIIVVAFTLADASFRFIETPFRKWSPHTLKAIGLAVTLIAVGLVGGNHLRRYSSSSWRMAGRGAQQPLASHFYSDHCNYNDEMFKKGLFPSQKDCVLGNRDRPPQILIVGNSHTFHYLFVIEKWLIKHDLSASVFYSTSCPPFVNAPFQVVIGGQIYERCRAFSEELQKRALENSQFKAVMIASRWDNYAETNSLPDGLTSQSVFLIDRQNQERSVVNSRRVLSEQINFTVGALNSAGKKVIWLGQVPMLSGNPTQCLERATTLLTKILPFLGDRQKCLRFDADFSRQRLAFSRRLEDEIVERYGLSAFFPGDAPNDFPKSIEINGELVYKDESHLTVSGARTLVEPFQNFATKHLIRPLKTP